MIARPYRGTKAPSEDLDDVVDVLLPDWQIQPEPMPRCGDNIWWSASGEECGDRVSGNNSEDCEDNREKDKQHWK